VQRALVVVLATIGVSAAAATAGVPAQTPVVRVTLRDANVTLEPSSVIAGNVVFKVANKARTPRDFEVGGSKTPAIAAGKSAMLRAAFAAHPYHYFSVGGRGAARLTGFLGVLPACSSPTATTVTVDIKLNQMSLSRTAVPCGTVTFEVTNTDIGFYHDFNLALVTRASGSVLGPRLRAGQSTTMVVNLPYKGQVYYYCREPEHDEMGESGFLTVR
jgi:hypothetical protein